MSYLITTGVHYTKTCKSNSKENYHIYIQMINVAELVIMRRKSTSQKMNLLHFMKASTLRIIH